MKKRFISSLFAMSAGAFMLVAGSAQAFEVASLQNQTSFGLHDEADPFDITLNTSKLFQIDRWRLFTNLGNYGNDGFYTLGTSGKVGPGSLAVFFETQKSLTDENDVGTDDTANLIRLKEPTTGGPTGTADRVIKSDRTGTFKDEDERHNVILSYGMDFVPASVGVSYRPELRDRKTSLDRGTGFLADLGSRAAFLFPGGADNYVPTTGMPTFFPLGGASPGEELNGGFTGGFVFDLGTNMVPISANFERSRVTTDFGDVAHTKIYSESLSDSFSGEQKVEDKDHLFKIASYVHTSPTWDLEADLGIVSLDRKSTGSATYTYANTKTVTGTTAAGENNPGFATGLADGYALSETQTTTWAGNFLGGDLYSKDGTGIDIMLEPRFNVNSNLAFEFGLDYVNKSGNANGGWTQGTTTTASLKTATADTTTQTWTGTETFDNTWSGDWDYMSIAIEPKAHIFLGPVDFSLGIGFEDSEDNLDGKILANFTGSGSFNDGDGTPNTGDFTVAATSTSSSVFSQKTETTTWSFPVATQAKITEKLTLRAGARFSRKTTKMKKSLTNTQSTDSVSTRTDGAGTVVVAGESSYTNAAAVSVGYDANTGSAAGSESQKTIVDTTDYRLGLGFQATENLMFDLMFLGEAGNTGMVTLSTVLASVVLAF